MIATVKKSEIASEVAKGKEKLHFPFCKTRSPGKEPDNFPPTYHNKPIRVRKSPEKIKSLAGIAASEDQADADNQPQSQSKAAY